MHRFIPIAFSALAVLLMCIPLSACSAGDPAGQSQPIQPTPTAKRVTSGYDAAAYHGAIRLIENSADKLTDGGADAAENLIASNANNRQKYGELSWDCVAAFDAAGAMEKIDPQRARRYVEWGTVLVNWYVSERYNNADGIPGWSLDGMVYSYQDGAVGNCLVDAYEQTKNRVYLSTMNSVMSAFWRFYTVNFDARCENCGYWWDDKNNDTPYIKNMNMWMSSALSKLYLFTDNPHYKQRALQTLYSEEWEIADIHNFSYLGTDSPKYSQFAIGDHITVEMVGFSRLAHNLRKVDNRYLAAIQALRHFWLYDCHNSGCLFGPYEIPMIHCMLAPDDPQARDLCRTFILSTTSTEAHQLTGLVEGLSAFS